MILKVLVMGSANIIGQVVGLFFKENGHSVTGYDSEPCEYYYSIQESLYNLDCIKETIQQGDYDAVFNFTAVVNQYAEEDKAEASYINCFLPHYLEKITRNTKTVIVHRSTDCVFSGKKGSYNIDDIPDGESFYAKTKAIGELINQKDITVRVSLIGPDPDSNGDSLFPWFLRQSGDVNGFTDAIWTGVTTVEFARVIEKLLLQKAHGLFQCAPDTSISKYELLTIFEKYFPNNRNVIPISKCRVDKSLIPFMGEYRVDIPNYDTMVADMLSWVKKHKKIYKNFEE